MCVCFLTYTCVYIDLNIHMREREKEGEGTSNREIGDVIVLKPGDYWSQGFHTPSGQN